MNKDINRPLVSIIVPVYNMGRSIKASVETLLKQDYHNIEIILVDDGSTDNSLEQCQALSKADNRVTVIHTVNRGSGPARNEGIALASGVYVYFPDADDKLEPSAISTLVSTFKSNPDSDLIVFGFKNVTEDGSVISEKKYNEAVKSGTELRNDYSKSLGWTSEWGIQGAPWNKFFKLSLIKGYKVSFPPLRRHQDEGFICRYMCYAQNVIFISPVLYTYYVNDIKKTWSKYPLNYIDSVIGLNEIRKQTIYKWNANDIETHDLLKKEYICNIIKSLELAFSPKMPKDDSCLKFIKEGIIKSGIKDVQLPGNLRIYHRLACHLLSTPVILMLLLRLKTFIEKIGLR